MRRMFSEKQIATIIANAISGGLLSDKDVEVKSLTSNGGAIIEGMDGYSFDGTGTLPTFAYVGVVKNGNKITFAIAGTYTRGSADGSNISLGKFIVPSEIASKLYPNTLGALANISMSLFSSTTDYKTLPTRMSKSLDDSLAITMYNAYTLTNDAVYEFRFEVTFLLSENLSE